MLNLGRETNGSIVTNFFVAKSSIFLWRNTFVTKSATSHAISEETQIRR